jgi:hypothetical protein
MYVAAKEGRWKPNPTGNLLTMSVDRNGITLSPTKQGVLAARELVDSRPEYWTALGEMLEEFTTNEWEWVLPEEIGAITDAPIISREVTRDDNGTVTEVGRVYAHMDYQVQDPIEAWAEGKAVRFVAA